MSNLNVVPLAATSREQLYAVVAYINIHGGKAIEMMTAPMNREDAKIVRNQLREAVARFDRFEFGDTMFFTRNLVSVTFNLGRVDALGRLI